MAAISLRTRRDQLPVRRESDTDEILFSRKRATHRLMGFCIPDDDGSAGGRGESGTVGTERNPHETLETLNRLTCALMGCGAPEDDAIVPSGRHDCLTVWAEYCSRY